jgi:hypothetical protein
MDKTMKQRRLFFKSFGLAAAGLMFGSATRLNAQEVKYPPAQVKEVRKACYQFALQYFHFCKALVDTLGEKQAEPVIRKALFELSLDRSNAMRAKAQEKGLELALENFSKVTDLARSGWDGWEPSLGGVFCPYAEVWLTYFDGHPWFKPLASLYCDVIDTTNIENFTRTTSHRITKNLLWGDNECKREYFESEQVKQGVFTYGK